MLQCLNSRLTQEWYFMVAPKFCFVIAIPVRYLLLETPSHPFPLGPLYLFVFNMMKSLTYEILVHVEETLLA